jgi:threonine/homoserine efflux transporter RhtA
MSAWFDRTRRLVLIVTILLVGRGTASDLSAGLYSGTPTSGALLALVILPYTLTFNDPLAIAFVVTTSIYENVEPGTTLGVRYNATNPRIALLEGDGLTRRK